MKLQLTRVQCGATCTIGTLTVVGGDFTCYTCEDIDRQLESGGEKIHGQTCIPRGTYQIILTMSQRFGRILPLLLGVPGFEGIRIHPGNTAADTEGCILPGLEVGQDGVLHSRDAFAEIMTRVGAAFARGERIDIEVV